MLGMEWNYDQFDDLVLMQVINSNGEIISGILGDFM